jgi:hypothetical protein
MARNYVKVLGWKFHYHSPTLPGIDGDLAAWGANDADLSAQRDRVIQLFNDANPGNDVEWTYPTNPVTAYILIDKPSVLQTLNWQGNGLYFYALSVGIALADQNLPMLVNPEQSPRYTGWKDAAGELHKPAPSDKRGAKADFSGAQGLFDAAAGLLAYAQALRDSGRIRDAGIVKYAYDRIFDQQWTVTQAFDYLRHNHLV